MSDTRGAVPQPSTDRVLESVADSTRRDALAVLLEEPEPVSVRELATAVAALETGRPYAEVTHADRKPVAVALVHVHLPKLAASTLLEWAPGEDVVATLDRPSLDGRPIREILSVDADDWDAVLGALADRRRRLALSILEGADGAVDRSVLARRVVARELDVPAVGVPDAALREARAELRHTHLPRLREAGLVTDDGESVAYDGHPELPPAWLSLEPGAPAGRDGPAGAADGGALDGSRPATESPERSADGTESPERSADGVED